MYVPRTADIAIHPSSRLPAAADRSGQLWLPPLWLWPTPPEQGCWEYLHEPEYLVRTGHAPDIGTARTLLGQAWIAVCCAMYGRDFGDHAGEIIGAAAVELVMRQPDTLEAFERAFHEAMIAAASPAARR